MLKFSVFLFQRRWSGDAFLVILCDRFLRFLVFTELLAAACKKRKKRFNVNNAWRLMQKEYALEYGVKSDEKSKQTLLACDSYMYIPTHPSAGSSYVNGHVNFHRKNSEHPGIRVSRAAWLTLERFRVLTVCLDAACSFPRMESKYDELLELLFYLRERRLVASYNQDFLSTFNGLQIFIWIIKT